jgi:HAD superfamily hydrolase (TIGR01509 family)
MMRPANICRVAATPAAVIFDLDGVLMDSEQLWNASKEALVREAGGRWRNEAPTVMMGMSSPEWSAYLHDELGVPLEAEAINREVVGRMLDGYRRELPLLPGASEAVRTLAARWPLGLASSSNREVIDLVLERSDFGDAFRVAVSSEEVERGKPAPDVYLTAAGRLGADPARCVAIEDSGNGLRSAAAAGMAVIAVPNEHYRPNEEALALAGASVKVVGEVTPELVERVVARAVT